MRSRAPRGLDIANQASETGAFVLPLEGKGDRSAVDEVKMRTVPLPRSVNPYRKKRPIVENVLQLSGAFVLPLEGKGDRFAVDEVKMRTVLLSRSVE